MVTFDYDQPVVCYCYCVFMRRRRNERKSQAEQGAGRQLWDAGISTLALELALVSA